MNFYQVLSSSFYAGVIVALIVGAVYLWNHRQKAVFLNVAAIILASQAVVGGPLLSFKALFPLNCDLNPSEKLYVFIGGLAVVWNAVLSLTKIVPKPKL